MSDKSKIYTKTGDKGYTSLLDGKRVPKFHLRIQAYGSIDELKSYLPLISLNQKDENISKSIFLIQEVLFKIEALLATDNIEKRIELPCISEEDVLFLENEIDTMHLVLPPLSNFIIPGGTQAAVHAHVARCICRRCERIVIELSQNNNVEELIVKYLNRLSDYLFVLSRILCLNSEKCKEIKWKTK